MRSITGSSVHGVRFEYGADGTGVLHKEIKLTAAGANTAEWTKSYSDMVGRPSTVSFSDGAMRHNFYNAKDQLAKQVDPDGVTTLFAYNAKAEQEYTAIDMDRNGAIDVAARTGSRGHRAR